LIEIGTVHISLALALWLVAALHGVWSRRRLFLSDRAQLRYNRSQGINGAMETYGARTVAESARALALYLFVALIGVVAAFNAPRGPLPDRGPGGVFVTWGLVGLVWVMSFSDYVVRWVAARLRHDANLTPAEVAAAAAGIAADLAHSDAMASLEVGRANLALSGVIHTLVNSQRTALLEDQLASTKRELELLRTARTDKAAIAVAEARVDALEALLDERALQAVEADAQTAAEEARASGST